MKKKILSTCLALLMLLTIIPISAKAAESYLWPVPSSKSTSRQYSSSHQAIDITGGGNIVATKSGTVYRVYSGCGNVNAASGSGKSCSTSTCAYRNAYYNESYNRYVCNWGYGNGVIIKHSDGSGYSMYAHMSSVKVSEGATVKQGDVLGVMGSTGCSTGTHLHFALSKSITRSGSYDKPTDPINNSTSSISYIYTTSGGGSSTISVTVKTGPAEEITATSAKVCGSMWVSGTTPTACGMYLGTTTSNMTKLGSDSISKVVDFWYYTAKAGRTLTAGTTYYCQAYIVAGGKTYWGNYYSFTTKNWVQGNGKWYYYRNGKAVTGWVLDNSSWYYMNGSGVMQTGWLDEGGSRYYLNSSGAMLTGWQTIGGIQYYFDSSGRLVPCKAGHSYGSWTVTKAATCTEAGTKQRTCTRSGCGASETEAIAALAHQWESDYVVDFAATETQPGEMSIHCAVCGERTGITAIPATGGQLEAGPSGFVDVTDPNSYFYEPVEWAVNSGVTTGTDATHFSPDGSCTRAQAVTFLWRAAGCPQPQYDVVCSVQFEDVSWDDYFFTAVSWARENGITTGTGEHTFSPHDTCTRAQIVTFLYRFSHCPETPGEAFSDVPVGAYYYDAVRWAVLREVTNGTGAGLFSPDAICTRGQIVTFLYRDQMHK